MTNEELVGVIQEGKEELLSQLWEQCKGFVYPITEARAIVAQDARPA